MARRRKGGYARRPQVEAKPEPASAAMAALNARTSEIDRRDAFKSEPSGPKPRAIRRYEKYANMGN